MIASPLTGKTISDEANIFDDVARNDEVVISFLRQDGTLVQESFELSDKGVYISKQDYRRYGKVESHNGKKTFYIKQYRGGRPGEILVDPYGTFFKPEDLSTTALHRGQRFCEYRKVARFLFDQYVTYLQTRDVRHFRNVEKQILDGDV